MIIEIKTRKIETQMVKCPFFVGEHLLSSCRSCPFYGGDCSPDTSYIRCNACEKVQAFVSKNEKDTAQNKKIETNFKDLEKKFRRKVAKVCEKIFWYGKNGESFRLAIEREDAIIKKFSEVIKQATIKATTEERKRILDIIQKWGQELLEDSVYNWHILEGDLENLKLKIESKEGKQDES